MIRTFKGLAPTVDKSAYVDQSAQVIGDVAIGAESSVWMNVVIRGDVNHIRIGKRTNIQDLTMIHVMRETHPTIIGDEVTVGHSAVVHGTTIEDRVLVGMAAVLLNGVHIESDCVIAAGTLLTEGTRIPSRSLVIGRPGKVKRQLTDEEVAEIRWYADNYVKYRLDYSTESRPSKPLGFK
ncbi:MAG: gamma carbonic anhydrase family protein [Acidobacteriota bacterium]|nr:gamma carbonic anhydrase family protein [Acidobacteriota bacterium]